MPEIAEVKFPHEARERISESEPAHDYLDGVDDPRLAVAAIRYDAMAVIEHLESDNAALGATIDFMRDRVTEAIRPR